MQQSAQQLETAFLAELDEEARRLLFAGDIDASSLRMIASCSGISPTA